MSATSLSTCLWFEKDAEAAAIFYCGLLPRSRITRIDRQQDDPQNRAFMVSFDLMGQHYLALNGGPHYQLSPAVSISVSLDTQSEIDRLWAALLQDGGSESRCGWLTDRWGLSWQILPEALPRMLANDPSGRVMRAMMAMVKFDIAALQAAVRD